MGTVGVQRDTEAVADGKSWRDCGLRRKGSQDTGLRNRDTSGADGGREASKGGRMEQLERRGAIRGPASCGGESGTCTTAQSLGR